MTSMTAGLSHIVQGLDRASVQMRNIDSAIRRGDSATANAALMNYVRELTSYCAEWRPVRLSRQHNGLNWCGIGVRYWTGWN